ncbi:MAG TPA: hypothetical protein VK716_12780 [Terracidiphilus sp.]|jgi:hypothetical protein|nr:hypothetical protein [Terracidiphilus sp.]
MNPLPAPIVPGKTEAERFDNALRKVLSVPKEELEHSEAESRKTLKKKTGPKRP